MTQSASKQHTSVNKRKSSLWTLYLAYLYILAIGGLVLIEYVSLHFLTGYVLLSIVTIIVYGWDKRAAQLNRWRTSEQSLQLLALIGGWPGAIWAQQKFRHKSKKRSFRIQLWLMIVLNISTFAWFFVPPVSNFIGSLIY
ncbi:DUF1294 domain-containing protein [Thalassotalea psychrophila]|uniref:DUF1294 domain-containing protein n=1 Tax=Thalassotalea psychrophila TaxID=3065647 RepID=A0ABY9TR13_9GAMM|nr:DUF1294 domain-containing protein [Colwelliaceae bacterium SQ149]